MSRVHCCCTGNLLQHTKQHVKQAICLLQNYERTGGMSAFGVDPDSNKAFIHWESKGKIGGDGPEGVSLFGLNMLIFDSYGLIKTVVGFRQPLPNERAKYLKKVAQHA